MQFYDMHTHILPEFDDGAKSVDEGLELINCLKNQGVTNICLTPHFYSNEMSAKDFAEERNAAFNSFLLHIPNDVSVVLGAEVFVTGYLFMNDDLSELTYGKSSYILTEFSYSSSFSEKTLNKLVRLIENHRLTPVLTHVERYKTLMSDISVLQELRDMGVIIQTNTVSCTEKAPFFKRRKLLKLISDGMIDILGTDTHSFVHNTPESYSQAVDLITEKCGSRAVRRMMQNAEKIFSSAIGEK